MTHVFPPAVREFSALLPSRSRVLVRSAEITAMRSIQWTGREGGNGNQRVVKDLDVPLHKRSGQE